MNIIELRILPPIAIGRLGSSSTPLEAYDLEVSKTNPLDFRNVIPKTSFSIDPETGRIDGVHEPDTIRFKDASSVTAKDGKIRPVAPFLEVFAITDAAPDRLVPLTTGLLQKAGLSLKHLHWTVEVGNIKLYRRTSDPNDKILARLTDIKNHVVHPLLGKCNNFLEGKSLPLGSVQFIAPSQKYPQIRLRYTPAEGKVYGSALKRHVSDTQTEDDPVITSEALVLYDTNKGGWCGYREPQSPEPNPKIPDPNSTYTNPAQIFAGYDTPDGTHVSWGYLDDECDGFVCVCLTLGDGRFLEARALISAGPPTFAPDTLPPRAVSDELEQILLGTEVEGEVPIDEAEEIVRRSLETLRLMNTAIMNGNPFEGRLRVASTMAAQDTNDFGRLYEPIMATSIVDNLALRSLHERVFNGLGTGAAAWFAAALRRPDKIGDLSSEQRRKMPGLMRGADGRALCLTHRQINTVIKAAASAMFKAASDTTPDVPEATESPLKANNLTAQLHYRGEGNPFSVLPRSAISNCFPGLEFDFRNLWRRAFDGIVLIENNNYVVDAQEQYKDLIGHRLVAIEHRPTMVPTEGPILPPMSPNDTPNNVPLKTADNPNGVSFMEWSNSLAFVLQKQGEEVVCHFTKEPSPQEIVVEAKDLDDLSLYQEVHLKVNYFFAGESAAFTADILQPGELTQGLCAPWQNDYRECACYYWAASRPDFVNVEPNAEGLSAGDNWMSKKRTGEYIPDDRKDSRLLSYLDLFKNWEGELSFILRGKDALETHADDHDGKAL